MLPKKSLGQNFLTSIPARIKIVEAGSIAPTDTILEIGPGRGFLTKGLLETGASVVALEKDTDLIPVLDELFASYKEKNRFTLIQGDVLLFDPSEHETLKQGYKIIANIPYYITGAIFSHFLSHSHKPTTMVVLIQKEVAERIVAHNKKESILSLSIKAYGVPRIVTRVNKGSFNPAPKVDSAVLAIEHISNKQFLNQYHEQIFFRLVKQGFLHKRKLLISNLKEVCQGVDLRKEFERVSLKETVRAEDVTLSTWLQLSSNIATHSLQ